MAKNKGSGAKKEDKTSGNAKGKGKGKAGGKVEKDTDSGTKKGYNEIYVRHILCEKHSKKEKALERLREGDAWDTVALEFAEHAGSKGGLLGWKTKLPRTLKEDFAKVAFDLEPSSLKSPNIGEAKTDQGYHLIVVTDRSHFPNSRKSCRRGVSVFPAMPEGLDQAKSVLRRTLKLKLSGNSRLPPYEYEGLPSESYIRLFILQQGRVDDPLNGSMKTVLLSDHSTKYEAISYVWGTDVMDHLISVDGRKLPITKNLDAALRQVRRTDQARSLWADSICINQKDNDEKGYQVALMGQIYETSSCTMVCLGVGRRLAEAEYARNIAIMVNKVNDLYEHVLNDPELSEVWNSFPQVEPTDPLVTDIKWMTSWNAMILHPWYYRGWVVQEVTRAPRACILWAGVEIDWRHILRFNYWLNLRAQHVTTTLTTPKQISSIHLQLYASRNMNESRLFTGESMLDRLKEMTTIDILGRGRSLQVKEPKDRIYALMHLLRSDGTTLQPDYAPTTSHLDVYRDFAIKYTEDKADLDLLNCVEHNQNTFDQESIPSWVPRWDIGGYPEPMLNLMDRIITGNTPQDYPAVQCVTITDGGSALRVRAVVFDTVKYVSETIKWQPGFPTSQIVGQVVSLWTQIRSQSREFPGPHQERLSLAFLAAICQGAHNGDWDKFKESMLVFAQLLQSEDPDPDKFPTTDKKAERVSRFATRTSGNRRLILLGRGYYAIAPELTREDDICVVIFGARRPFILRKVAVAGVDEFHCKLIGAAYVQSKYVHVNNEIPLALGEECAGDETYDWREYGLPTEDIVIH